MNRLLSCFLVACCITVLFSCQKEMSEEVNSALTASGSLWDTAANCLPDSVHGTFYGGITPGSDTAYVEVQVNVTQTGSYSISSDVQDGFQFADSGFFSSTGLNTIHLKPLGTPIIPTTSTFSISFDSSFCSFTVVIQDSTGTGLGGHQDTTGTGSDFEGNWQFTTADGTFSGSFDTAVIITDSAIWGTGDKMLYMNGFKTNSVDSAIDMYVYLPTGAIVPGTYTSQSLPPSNSCLFGFIAFDLNTGVGTPIYQALPADTNGTNLTINIISYDAVTHVVTGTFSGTAGDVNDTANATVTNGNFTATVTP